MILPAMVGTDAVLNSRLSHFGLVDVLALAGLIGTMVFCGVVAGTLLGMSPIRRSPVTRGIIVIIFTSLGAVLWPVILGLLFLYWK